MNIEETLRSLGLEDVIEVFHDNNIDEEAVLLLGDSELKELIPKIGPRLKFKKYIESFKSQNLTFTVLEEDFVTAKSGSSFSASVAERLASTLSEVESTTSTKTVDSDWKSRENSPEKEKSAEKSENLNAVSIDGRAILKEGQSSEGLLREGSRRKLSQLVIGHIIDKRPSSKIATEEFCRLASEIVQIFPRESIVVYYSAYLAGKDDTAKKNASGKLYETYITRRRKLRHTGELPGTSRASSNSSKRTSNPTPSASSENSEVNDDNLTWLKNNVDPWKTVEEKWSETHDYRLKNIGDINEYFHNYPALKQPEGYTLLMNDFNRMYPGKDNNLFSAINLKQEDICAYAKNKAEHGRDQKLKTAILDLIGLIDEDDTETAKNVCLMLLAYVINVSPARKRKGKPALKFSRAEICDGYIRQVSSEAEVTTVIIEKREEITKQQRTLQPFLIFVGKSVTEVKAAYVVINNTVYHFNKLITAVDCAFKIFQSTGACYPEECEDIWLFIQLGFYNIKTKFDRHTQVVNTLLTDLGLIK